jgi:hypothetical protein
MDGKLVAGIIQFHLGFETSFLMNSKGAGRQMPSKKAS